MSRLKKLEIFALRFSIVNITKASIRHMAVMKHLKTVHLPKSKKYSSKNPRFQFGYYDEEVSDEDVMEDA